MLCRVVSCRVVSCRVVSCLALPCLVLSCLVLSDVVLSSDVMSSLVLLGVVLSCFVVFCLVLFCLVLRAVVFFYMLSFSTYISCLVALIFHMSCLGVVCGWRILRGLVHSMLVFPFATFFSVILFLVMAVRAILQCCLVLDTMPNIALPKVGGCLVLGLSCLVRVLLVSGLSCSVPSYLVFFCLGIVLSCLVVILGLSCDQFLLSLFRVMMVFSRDCLSFFWSHSRP